MLLHLLVALKKFIADSVRDTEIKLAIPNCPYAELDEREFYFFLENLKKSGFSEEFDKQVGNAKTVSILLFVLHVCPTYLCM